MKFLLKLSGKEILLAFCAKFKKFAFLPKCIISAKYFLSYSKTNLEKFWFRFYGPKNASFLFFIFLLWRLSNHFFMKKPTIFITNIKSTHSSYIFTMIWHLETFGNETLKKKKKNYAFWRLILTNVERKKSWILRIFQIWSEVLRFWKIVI